MRLVGATDSFPLGRLEVHMDGKWGTVCSVSKGAAESVCHQLGYQVVVMSDTVTNLGWAREDLHRFWTFLLKRGLSCHLMCLQGHVGSCCMGMSSSRCWGRLYLLQHALTVYHYFRIRVWSFCISFSVAKASKNTPIVLSDVNCEYDPFGDGPELHILRCAYSQKISADCTHEEDAAIQCGMCS